MYVCVCVITLQYITVMIIKQMSLIKMGGDAAQREQSFFKFINIPFCFTWTFLCVKQHTSNIIVYIPLD